MFAVSFRNPGDHWCASVSGMELGVDRFLFAGPNVPSRPDVNPVPDLLEEMAAADVAGLDAFGIGEHHTAEFADAAPAVLLAAAAARTQRIRLSSAITILSVADPMRIFEDFATLDLTSNGRAEIIAGRGAYAEASSLFGLDLGLYDEVYAEKIDLLLKLRAGEPIHWHGRHRPALTGQTIRRRSSLRCRSGWVRRDRPDRSRVPVNSDCRWRLASSGASIVTFALW